MIEAATKIHDNVWPTSSPSPIPKMAGCSTPEPQCVKLKIAHKLGKGHQCTKPLHVPTGFFDDCPRRIYDWKPSQSAQTSPEAKAPNVTTWGKTADIREWLVHCLDWLTQHSGKPGVRIYAQTLLDDADTSVSIDVMLETGAAMLERKNVEQPWNRPTR